MVQSGSMYLGGVKQDGQCVKTSDFWCSTNWRVELDASDDRFPKKIRNASKAKVPYVLIAGEDDRAAGAVSFRYRDGSQRNGVPVDEAIEEIVAAVAARVQVTSAPKK